MLIENSNVDTLSAVLPIVNTVLSDAVFRPMLFSELMVQALLDGRKTQTRRVIKLPKDYTQNGLLFPNGEFGLKYESKDDVRNTILKRLPPPIGVGDIIWVRETWSENPFFDQNNDVEFLYRATDRPFEGHKWQPSLFMPKAACRLFLEVTNVRVERLNDISEIDAEKEGINLVGHNCYENYLVSKDWNYLGINQKNCHMLEDPVGSFASIWCSSNGLKSWELNPFVWMYDFKLVERPHGFR